MSKSEARNRLSALGYRMAIADQMTDDEITEFLSIDERLAAARWVHEWRQASKATSADDDE